MSLLNFRDPAWIADPEGTVLRPGVLFRSAQPLPAADARTVELLRGAGIGVVVDLRSGAEREPADWAAAEEAGIEVVEAAVDPSSRAARRELRTLRTNADLGAFYLAMADSSPAAIATVVRAVADRGPVLVHCAAGKDRTGLMVALLLDLLGVPWDRIAADYARTADALPELFPALAARRHTAALNRQPPIEGGDTAGGDARGEKTLKLAAPLGQAPAEAILAFLDGVRTRNGGAEAFLLTCGLSVADLDGFRAATAPVPALAPAPAPAPGSAPCPG
jgi:protein-tyrosine phosphatase